MNTFVFNNFCEQHEISSYEISFFFLSFLILGNPEVYYTIYLF
jgi:hypothetical protein